MESEWIIALSLLLPTAAYLGWFLVSKKELDLISLASRNIQPEYLKGFNYVLNEEQDKAIELFIKMLEVGDRW